VLAHRLHLEQKARDRSIGRGKPVGREFERRPGVEPWQSPSSPHAIGGSNTVLLRIAASAQLRVKASHAFEHRLTSYAPPLTGAR